MRVSDWGGEDEHDGESEDDDGDEWSCGRIEGLSPLRFPGEIEVKPTCSCTPRITARDQGKRGRATTSGHPVKYHIQSASTTVEASLATHNHNTQCVSCSLPPSHHSSSFSLSSSLQSQLKTNTRHCSRRKQRRMRCSLRVIMQLLPGHIPRR
jgi:hypothetical protein